MSPVRPLLLVALAAPVLLTGCVPSGQAEALGAGNAFQAALRSQNGAAACDLLAPETRTDLERGSAQACPQVLTRRSLPTGAGTSIQVWGGNAQLRLASGVVFLAKFRTGWKVTAAGCTPRQDQPYDCTVAG
jgi:hypothetical protein